MLQNRVDPFGTIIKTSARGQWLGNRGVIHNHQKEITRAYRHKAWIICELEFKGRKRQIMSPGKWTELFFLDEATAFAAGHRPCFECRRQDALRFKQAWLQGNANFGLRPDCSINAIDACIHEERIGQAMEKKFHQRNTTALVDGTFVVVESRPFLFFNSRYYPWTPFGYEPPVSFSETSMSVITPNSIVNAFAAGYRPQISLPIIHVEY